MIDKVQIAGMLIHTRPDAMPDAMQTLRDLSTAEIHDTGLPGKFVAVLECAHERELGKIIEAIQALPGVVSVAMTSHFIEDSVTLAAEMPNDD